MKLRTICCCLRNDPSCRDQELDHVSPSAVEKYSLQVCAARIDQRKTSVNMDVLHWVPLLLLLVTVKLQFCFIKNYCLKWLSVLTKSWIKIRNLKPVGCVTVIVLWYALPGSTFWFPYNIVVSTVLRDQDKLKILYSVNFVVRPKSYFFFLRTR